jgi:hypothetical protein
VFRWIEDYLLVPRVIGRAVKVPAGVTMVAVLIGGALLGVVGALVAIPVAAALQLLTQEVLFPHSTTPDQPPVTSRTTPRFVRAMPRHRRGQANTDQITEFGYGPGLVVLPRQVGQPRDG